MLLCMYEQITLLARFIAESQSAVLKTDYSCLPFLAYFSFMTFFVFFARNAIVAFLALLEI